MINPKVTISGFDIEWDLERGVNVWAGVPTLSMWIPTSVAGLMSGLASMVGVERFNLCLQVGGQQSVDGDWGIIASAPTFEEGLALLAGIAWPAGWGRWDLVSLDREGREARFRVHNGWEAIYQHALGVKWGSAMMAGKLSGIMARVFETPCWAEQTSFAASGDAYDEFVVKPTDATTEDRLARLLDEGRATHSDLALALEKLKREAEERQRTERELRDKLAVIEEQESVLTTLAAPLLEVWDGVLAVPVMGGLDNDRAASLMERLLQSIADNTTRHVILDLTAVERVDTDTADHLVRIVRAAELIGAHVVVTGIRPGVSQTIVALRLDLGSITTLRSLREGLKLCMKMVRDEARANRPAAPRGT